MAKKQVTTKTLGVTTRSESKIYINETHPISAELGGNGNGLVISSMDILKVSEWIIRRLQHSDVKEYCCLSLVLVK